MQDATKYFSPTQSWVHSALGSSLGVCVTKIHWFPGPRWICGGEAGHWPWDAAIPVWAWGSRHLWLFCCRLTSVWLIQSQYWPEMALSADMIITSTGSLQLLRLTCPVSCLSQLRLVQTVSIRNRGQGQGGWTESVLKLDIRGVSSFLFNWNILKIRLKVREIYWNHK